MSQRPRRRRQPPQQPRLEASPHTEKPNNRPQEAENRFMPYQAVFLFVLVAVSGALLIMERRLEHTRGGTIGLSVPRVRLGDAGVGTVAAAVAAARGRAVVIEGVPRAQWPLGSGAWPASISGG